MTRMSGRGQRFTADEIIAMLRMQEAGRSLDEIAAALGMKRQRVYDRLRGNVRGYSERRRPAVPAPQPRPVPTATALPVHDAGFIAPPTKAQLMARRA